MKEHLMKIEEVALMIDSSVQTLNNWYRFKKIHPDSIYSEMLPDYIQEGNRKTRYWNREDIWKLIQFKNAIPHGRNGILGDITQVGSRKKKEAADDKT